MPEAPHSMCIRRVGKVRDKLKKLLKEPCLKSVTRKASLWLFLARRYYSREVEGGVQAGLAPAPGRQHGERISPHRRRCRMPVVRRVARPPLRWHRLHPSRRRFALQNSLPSFPRLHGVFTVSASLLCQLFVARLLMQQLGRCSLQSGRRCRSPVGNPTLTPWDTCPWVLHIDSG